MFLNNMFQFYIYIIVIHICQILKPKIIEGNSNKNDSSTYQDNGLSDDPLYLATINASNIQYLKDNLDDITNLTNIVMDLSGRILQNTNAITAINCNNTLSCINLFEYFLLVSPPLNKVPIPRISTTPTAIKNIIEIILSNVPEIIKVL